MSQNPPSSSGQDPAPDPATRVPPPPGSIVPSLHYPAGRSILLEERPDYSRSRLVDQRARRDWVS